MQHLVACMELGAAFARIKGISDVDIETICSVFSLKN